MRKSWAGLARLRPGSVARAEDLLTACVRECASYTAGLTKPPGPKRTKLVTAIAALVVEHTASEPSQARTFEALLRVGDAAVAAEETRLARRVADTAIALRARSRGAWRLRGQTAESEGRDKDAIDAYERYQALAGGPGKGIPEIRERLSLLREKWAALAEASRILPEERLTEQLAHDVPAILARAVERRLAAGSAADPDSQRLAAAYATYCRLADSGRTDDPLLGGAEPIGVGALRTRLKGRGVCVVANAEDIRGSDLGEEIDSYDLVVRVDSFRLDHASTGTRLDLHAVSHRTESPGCWRRKADIRLVFGDKPAQWRQAIRHRLVPGAQKCVGDRSLSRPVRDPALIGEPRWAADASTGFTVARLLDFLDVSPRIDLIGFNLPGQLRPEERQWLLAHARRNEGLRIALR